MDARAALLAWLLPALAGCAGASRVEDSSQPWTEPDTFDVRVREVRESYAKAWRLLTERTGLHPAQPRLRIYRTREAFLRDLGAAGFSRDTVESFRRGGAPRPMFGTLWVPPQMDAASVCHELTHVFIEALAGEAFQRSKWLDEGYATYFEVSRCGGSRAAPTLPVPLAEMTTASQWRALRLADGKRVYASAWVAIDRLVARFGEPKILELIAATRDRAVEEVLQQVLGVDLAGAQAIADGQGPPGPP